MIWNERNPHCLGNLRVEGRPLGREPIGTIRGELVREVSARDEDGAATKLVDGTRDELAKMIVLDGTESG